MTPRQKDEHLGISIDASKGSLSWLKWLIPILISAGIFSGTTIRANEKLTELDSRVSDIETTIASDNINVAGQSIQLKNYEAKLVDLQNGQTVLTADVKQILILLTRK